MTKEEEEEFAEAYEKHKGYRRSGMTLMTTVITLSTGALVGLKTVGGQRATASVLFGLISIALVQQLLNYLAETQEARGTTSWLMSKMQNQAAANVGISAEARLNAITLAEKSMKSSFKYHKRASCMYRVAEWLCVIAVAGFLAAGFWIACHLPRTAPAAGQ